MSLGLFMFKSTFYEISTRSLLRLMIKMLPIKHIVSYTVLYISAQELRQKINETLSF